MSLLIAEILLRLVHVPHKVASGWSWNDSPRRSLATYQNDLPNELGYRGQPIKYSKDDYVVVLLGDSQVEAATSPPDKMPEKFLERYLSSQLNRPVKVFSLAASGWGQDQELLALDNYYKKYRADLVLVWATPGNDFWENAFVDRSVTKTAGHLKPTFKLVNNELQGPYYKSDFYYNNSAILQLIASAYAKYQGISLEQMILYDWISNLPLSHEVFNNVDLNESCADFLPIDQIEYSVNIYDLKLDSRFILLSGENFFESKSHFSPFLVNRSPRDNYLVSITKKIYDRINETATKNNSRFKVFLPGKKVNPRSDLVFVKCVQNLLQSPRAREVKIDPKSLLKDILSENNLLFVDLPGGSELSFSKTDRHLSDIGNERAMKNLAPLLAK